VSDGPTYGSGIGADSLANMQVGGPNNLMASYRFRATTSSALTSVRIYVIDGTGYAGGTGGSIAVSIQADDGTANHFPSGTDLASATIRPGNPVSIGYLPLVTFSSPPVLAAGTLYHVVFRNVDPSPTVNYVSVNSLFVFSPPTPQQPRFADLDWAALMKDGSGWTVRRGFTPILALNYANGEQAGQGYMEVWISGYEPITGSTAMVRESFTLSGASRTVSSVGVRLKRTSGTSPLVVRLETASGSLVAKTSIPTTAIAVSAPTDWGNGGSTWATATFSSPVTLAAGQRYNLSLSTAADTEYSIYAIHQGVDYGFGPTTYFGDGLAYSTLDGGSTWNTFGYSGAHYGQSDLQFYLR
jgi:hypothetical protein